MNITPNKKTLRIKHYALLITFILATLFYKTAFAQGTTPPTDDEVNAIAHKLYCPVCESTPLDVCPTDACKDWRELIRTMLADGKTEDEILKHFEQQYGARVLAEPPKQGFYWLIYLLPPIIILAGAVMLFRSLKDWTKPKETESNTGAESRDSLSDEYINRIEEELKKQK